MAQTKEEKAAYIRKWAAENPDKIKANQERWRKRHPDKYRQLAREVKNKPDGRAGRLYYGARSRARKLGVDFDLDLEIIKEKVRGGKCEVTGLPFKLQTGRDPFAPSLDRIDPKKGYTNDNVQVVAWIYNTAKGVGSDEDVRVFARAVLNPL